MKKIVILLLAAVLLLSGCAKRPDKLIDGEETETEIVYEEPPESYLDELAESFHVLNAPDSVFCYTDPLIKEEDYVSPEELEYDLKAKKETRFISCNQYADYPLTMVYADGTETASVSSPCVRRSSKAVNFRYTGDISFKTAARCSTGNGGNTITRKGADYYE